MKREECIVYKLRFKTYIDAVRFLTHLAEIAERHGHHPDVELKYTNLVLRLTTHDAGNKITDRDLALAKEIDRLIEAHRDAISSAE
ncbi:4a-hydroxytetrahydrobiopterin dehydratase [Pyrobaculum ferrireducens]|uniref:4a-hydroxytetrahydrobiopterin dehydratase n=2 Tax=Pyrobaculum ferrireducens TaxID=1104324 RepID=G7VH31_9CREN|nr:4a-hydroxytetrahydrobiopterin dehydratase [Pyrobaculum ferrireducens]